MKTNPNRPPRDAENCASLAVAVLAGGASRRFGADKALVQLCPDGRTLLERTVDLAGRLADEVFVVGHDRYAPLIPGVEIIPDRRAGDGPLAGIQSALRHASSQRVLVLACDMPCVSIALLRWMASLETDTDLVVPRTNDGRWHPIPAIYARSALAAVEASLESGNRAVKSIMGNVQVREVSEREMRVYDPNLDSLLSLNTPDQLAWASACVACK